MSDGARVARFGPDPAARFYKLDEGLLWCELRPLDKLVLIDLLHRERRGGEVPAQGQRAEKLCVSHDSLERAEKRLMAEGYLLRRERPGRTCLYLAAFPPVPKGDRQRREFEGALTRFAEQMERDHPQNAGAYLTQNAGATYRKLRELPTQNAGGRRGDTLLPPLKREEGRKRTPAPPAASAEEFPAALLPGEWRTVAQRWVNERKARFDGLFGFCDAAALSPLWDCVAFYLEQGRHLGPEVLDGAERDARSALARGNRGRGAGVISPRAFAIGLRRVLDGGAARSAGRETMEEQAARLLRECEDGDAS